MAFIRLEFVLGQSLLALTVYYDKKMDDRKNSGQLSFPPRDRISLSNPKGVLSSDRSAQWECRFT